MEIKEAEVYTVPEVAKILKTSESTIRRRIRDGSINSVKMGKIRRIRGRDVIEYLDKSIEKKV